MAQLDGVWDVQRTGGLLPPLGGMRKRISGTRGRTIFGPLRMGFEVRGTELHYRSPFEGFVDVLEPAGEGLCHGRATFRGRPFATFDLRRTATAQANELEQQLVKHIDEALAMEKNVQRMLDGMIETTDDPAIKSALQRHRAETEAHATRMRKRLEAHGESPFRRTVAPGGGDRRVERTGAAHVVPAAAGVDARFDAASSTLLVRPC